MRTIKFRAWDKKEKKMYQLKMLVWTLSGDSWVVYKNGENLDKKRLELLQYTGLKDKNKVEMFDGDLFKETYEAGYSIYEVCFGKYDNGREYEGNISGNGWYTKEHAHWPEYEIRINNNIDDMENLEVIGNIYENKDLLK